MYIYATLAVLAIIVAIWFVRRGGDPITPSLPLDPDADRWVVPPSKPVSTTPSNRLWQDEEHALPKKKAIPVQRGWEEEDNDGDDRPTGQRWSKKGIWYETEVVGEPYYQANIEQIRAGRSNPEITAQLILEDDNKYDKNAVRVEIDGLHVGYLDRADAKLYRSMLKDKQTGDTTPATIRGNPGHRDIYLGLDMRNCERGK